METTYYIEHRVYGTEGRVTGSCSLRHQRLLWCDELFRPTLRQALFHTVAAYIAGKLAT